MKNYFMIRTPSRVVAEGYVGYGWGVNFSEFSSSSDLIYELLLKYKDIGRKRNIIKYFFNLKSGDIVVVPMGNTVVFGIVDGEKRFVERDERGNQVKVNFIKKNGQLLRIPRSELQTSFSAMLKYRAAIAPLNDFSNQIDEILNNPESYSIASFFESRRLNLVDSFKKKLLHNIRTGDVFIKSGGRGLEELVIELLKIEGYKAAIQPKNQSSTISDADIIATREGTFLSEKLVVQVKHHNSDTSTHGVKQLIAYEDDADKWLITTGSLSTESKEFASNHGIETMDGEEFLDWLYESIALLGEKSLSKLGVIMVPTLVSDCI